MYALRERRVHVTQEDLELAVAKASETSMDLISFVFLVDSISGKMLYFLIRSKNYCYNLCRDL